MVIIPMSGEKEMRNPQFLESHALEHFAGRLCIHYPAQYSQSSLEVISGKRRTLFHRQGVRFSSSLHNYPQDDILDNLEYEGLIPLSDLKVGGLSILPLL